MHRLRLRAQPELCLLKRRESLPVPVHRIERKAQLVSRLRQANPDDDTCILAARPVTGETRDLRHHLRPLF